MSSETPRPPTRSLEFRPYFEAVIKSSSGIEEAVKRMGYSAAESVLYHIKKFGIETPDHWYPRPSSRGPDFRSYFEAVVKSSKGVREAAERIGYAHYNTVVHHMKRFGIKSPDHWYSRPPARSAEFRAYFEAVVKSSKSRVESARQLGYRDTKVIWHHMKRLGIKGPDEWHRRPKVAQLRREGIPVVIIPTPEGRKWVAGLLQGEGCIQSRYAAEVDKTVLDLDVAMTDSGPVFRFSEYVGLSHPAKPVKNHDWKPNWHKNVSGLRALRVLREILPFLLGDKKKEADRAIAFFGSFGDCKGCFRNRDIWPTSEFPWRTKKRGSPSAAGGDGIQT
jgi:hypothetical protein